MLPRWVSNNRRGAIKCTEMRKIDHTKYKHINKTSVQMFSSLCCYVPLFLSSISFITDHGYLLQNVSQSTVNWVACDTSRYKSICTTWQSGQRDNGNTLMCVSVYCPLFNVQPFLSKLNKRAANSLHDHWRSGLCCCCCCCCVRAFQRHVRRVHSCEPSPPQWWRNSQTSPIWTHHWRFIWSHLLLVFHSVWARLPWWRKVIFCSEINNQIVMSRI